MHEEYLISINTFTGANLRSYLLANHFFFLGALLLEAFGVIGRVFNKAAFSSASVGAKTYGCTSFTGIFLLIIFSMSFK